MNFEKIVEKYSNEELLKIMDQDWYYPVMDFIYDFHNEEFLSYDDVNDQINQDGYRKKTILENNYDKIMKNGQFLWIDQYNRCELLEDHEIKDVMLEDYFYHKSDMIDFLDWCQDYYEELLENFQ